MSKIEKSNRVKDVIVSILGRNILGGKPPQMNPHVVVTEEMNPPEKVKQGILTWGIVWAPESDIDA